MKRKVGISIMALGILSLASINTFAKPRTVSIHILASQTGVNSGILNNCTSRIGLKGNNAGSSKHALYVEAYEDVYGPDVCEKSYKVSPGRSLSYTDWKASSQGGDYYVHLDPAGPYTKGCAGTGTLFD